MGDLLKIQNYYLLLGYDDFLELASHYCFLNNFFSLCLHVFLFLAAQISNPFAKFRLFRNPIAKNEGKFMTLDDFLTFAKNATSVSGGVLITIEVS